MALITSDCGAMCSPNIKWPESPRIVRPSEKYDVSQDGHLDRQELLVMLQVRRRHDGPNHLGLSCDAIPEHQMALITSDCDAMHSPSIKWPLITSDYAPSRRSCQK